MTSGSAGYAGSPEAKEQDSAWQLHSSTDSYLNWTPASNGQGAPPTRYRDADREATSTHPQKTPLLSPKTPPAFQGTSPMASSSTDASSVISLHGHAVSPERSTSPSYFQKLYLQGQSRSNTGGSPTITFSSASSEPAVKADASVSPRAFLSSEASLQSQPAELASTSASSSKNAQFLSGAPLSPAISAKSGSGNAGFFSSKLPSPPVTAQPASQRGTEPDPVTKSRRPSSVFEHVGNVWERFGRKVHNARPTEPTSSISHRSASQTRSSVAPDSEDSPDTQRGSISSTQSHPSPTRLTYLDTSDPVVSPALPSAGSSSSAVPTSAASSGRNDANLSVRKLDDDEAEELPYLAPAPRPLPASSANASHNVQTHRRSSSAFERVLIQVTDDNERFSVVDISGVNSADAIKERMLAKLHLFDADFSSFQLFRTEVGQSEATGHTVNDDALLVLCLQMGDDRGTLKFLIQQIAPPSNSTVRAMPPPISSGGLPRINDSSRGPSTSGSSASQRLRSGSQSSKSSVSDALVFTDSFGNGEEASNRNSGSSLTRTKAQARRTFPNAPPSEDARSPVQSNGAYQQTSQDRRSIGSSADSPAHERTARSDVLRNVSSEAGLGLKAGASAYPQQSSGINGRRSSQAELARKRTDEDGGPQRLPISSNQRSQRLERSEGGVPDQQRQNGGPSLMIHNTKSMDDLRHQQSDIAVHHELKLHPSFDRDGRYPDPAIMRPSTAAPTTGRDSSGYGHRQYSSEAQVDSTAGSMPSQSDARLLTRNRSAQAALPGGAQLSNQGSQQQQSGPPQLRSPSLPVQHANPIDPRFSRNDDPRYGLSVGYSSHTVPNRTGNVGRPQYSAPPTYSYPNLPFQQPSRMSVPSPGYLNEFGGRAPTQAFNTYHGHDPRLANNRQGPPPPRPFSYHEQNQPPYVRPFAQQNAPTPVYHSREDPFTTRYFPASSSRQVSEFQLKAGHLQPGMTVQETLRSKVPGTQPGLAYGHGQQYPTGPTYGPRDPRQAGPAPNQSSVYQGQNPAPMQQQRVSHQQHHHPQQQLQPSQHQPQQYVRQPQPSHQHQHHQQHQEHATSHAQSQFRNPYDRPASMFETNVSPPQGQLPHPSSTSRGYQSQMPSNGVDTDPYQRRSSSRPNTSERSSGSSFGSQSSLHGRHHSAEEDRHGRSSMEEIFSAPTSARSSQSGAVLPKPNEPDNRRSYPSARHEGDLPDDELAHVRPLPQPPGSSAFESQRKRASQDRTRSSTGRKSEEEDTLRAGDWASLWKALDPKSGNSMSGTAISGSSGGDGDTLRAESGTPGLMKQTDSDTLTPESRSRLQRAASVSLAPDENGTVASFGTFDDDDSESGTWAQPLDSKVDAPRLPVRASSDRGSFGSGDHGTLQPGSSSITILPGAGRDSSPASAASNLRRPELRLTIDPAAGPTQMAPSSSRQSGNSPLPNSAHLSSGGISRSNSFAQTDNDWAFRPPPEQLYENLDNFFPKHDLDKPLLDTAAVPENTAVSSPRSESSPVTLPSPANLSASAAQQQQHLLGQRGRHKKSIRLVAQDRKRFLDKTEKRPTSQESETSGGLLRRRSTKLWGTKVIEMTPGQEVAAPASAISADSPSSDTSVRPVFKWVKGDLIGKGTYGRVYLALNATTGEMIAVKQVELPRTASDREDSRQKGVVAALKSEIETLKDLDHPHIVSYLGFEETSSFLSIFLEYVPGGSVGSCLRKHGKFEEQTIKSFLHQILEGLAYLHSKGILHRDLKADNILVDFEGVCKISDFGTVRRSDDIYGNVENMSLQGSIFWMAPEVVSLSKKGYSAKVDIWSLGCVVLEMFAGRRPWSEDEAVQAMFKIGAERKAPPIPADVKLSKQAAHFLKNCFEVDPAKRPTAQRLLDHVFSVTEPDWRFQQSALFRSLHR